MSSTPLSKQTKESVIFIVAYWKCGAFYYTLKFLTKVYMHDVTMWSC
jgi:hypothetical protein